MDMKKLYVLIAVVGLVPLLIVITFFIYRIKLKKESSQGSFRSGDESASISSEWIQSSQSALQGLAENALLRQYLDHTVRSSTTITPQPGEQQKLLAHFEEFQSRHPEFEKIVLKDSQTGGILLKMPAAEGETTLSGLHLLVAIPVSGTEEAARALLQGFINIDLLALPQKEVKRESFSSGKKKLAMVFVWLFLFLVLIIPFIMFMIYRQMNKMLDAQLPAKTPPPKPPWEINKSKDSRGKEENE